MTGKLFVILLSLTLSTPSFADAWSLSTRIPGRDWQKTFQLVRNHDDPVAQKLLTWLYVTETDIYVAPADLVRFSLENSGWPKLHIFRDRIEEDKGLPSLRPAAVASWFDRTPPASARGLQAYMSALFKLGQHDKANERLRKFWLSAELGRKETASLAELYRRHFSPTSHVDRLDALLWDQRYEEAEYMLPLVDKDARALAQARMALGRLSSKASKLVHAVPAALQNDEGLLYDRLRWRRQMRKDRDAFDILQRAPRNPTRPEMWWKERNILARRAIEDKNFIRAYKIADNHGMTAGVDYSQAEWLLGWLALEFLGQPDIAYRHFDDFYQAVTSAVSRSRAAYWLARAADAMKQKTDARNWTMLCAQFSSTFYGQLCHEELHGPMNAAQFLDEQVTPEDQRRFDGKELVRAVNILSGLGMVRYADAFFIKLLDAAKTRPDFVMIAKLARKTNHLRFAVEANKQLQQKLGDFMPAEGYPLLPSLPAGRPEAALVNAIVHRESMFDAGAVSSAGARGLMQLMPSTAKQVSRSIGKKFAVGKLTDNPQYNVELGAAYLQSLLDDYGGFYPLAIAAYNAGPRNVDEWMRTFGDPRRAKTDIIAWIELIPIYETRNYVQRVMESYYMYKLKLGEKPRTVTAFRQK